MLHDTDTDDYAIVGMNSAVCASDPLQHISVYMFQLSLTCTRGPRVQCRAKAPAIRQGEGVVEVRLIDESSQMTPLCLFQH